ncbi:MAG: glycosyltransferase family 4 protein [Candidatus Eisenbacteria bacterium]|nr:glycosyltransferase family 4 protein [Candidatus Eisenbacteria bacterium]
MKVLLVSLEYPPYSFGGVGSHVFHLSRALARKGIEVGVLSPGAVEGDRIEGNIRHFTTTIAGIPGCKLLSFALKVPGCVERVRRKFPFDVIHSHFGPCAFLGRTTLDSTTLIETAHGTHVGELLALRPLKRLLPKEVLGKFCLYPVLALLDLLSYRKSSRIIAVSELAREEVSRYGPGLREKTVVVPNGIELSEFPLEISQTIRSETQVRCLTVAFMQARKGLDYLLEAFSLINDRRVLLTIVGDGPHFGRLKKLAGTLGVTDRVSFAGRLTRAALMDEFRHSQLFVLPSLWEGQGIVFLEAAASGLPIVATRIPGVSGMLEDGVNALLVPPRDKRGLADAIQRLVAHPELRFELASEGLKRVRLFDWDRLVGRIISLYSSATEGRDEK